MQRLGRLFWYLLFSSNEFSAWKMRSIFSCQDHFGWGDWHSALTDKQWFDQLYLLHHLTKSGRCDAYANVAMRRRGLYCWCEVVTLIFIKKKKTLSTQTKTHLEFSFFSDIKQHFLWAGKRWSHNPCSHIHWGWNETVSKTIFATVGNNLSHIRNDSWTWWNCIPIWKTKLLWGRHDFLVLAPC